MTAFHKERPGLYSYKLIITNKTFTDLEVRGLDISITAGVKQTFDNILIRRPLYSISKDLYTWATSSLKLKKDMNIKIVLVDRNGNGLLQWNVKNAVPVRYSSPQFEGDHSPFPVESVEIKHDGWTLSVLNAKELKR